VDPYALFALVRICGGRRPACGRAALSRRQPLGYQLTKLLPAAAKLHCGVWFWNNTTLPDGISSLHASSVVVGDPAKEAEVINFTELSIKDFI
jgi:hypothetical protein